MRYLNEGHDYVRNNSVSVFLQLCVVCVIAYPVSNHTLQSDLTHPMRQMVYFEVGFGRHQPSPLHLKVTLVEKQGKTAIERSGYRRIGSCLPSVSVCVCVGVRVCMCEREGERALASSSLFY